LVSTLTKVLVVLLTLSAIFLCGIVVTYAVSATNYKGELDKVSTDNKSLAAERATLTSQLNETLKAKQDEIATLQDQISKLTGENSNMQSQVLTLTSSRDELQERITGWTGTMQKNQAIVSDLNQQLATTRTELDKARSEMVADRGQLSQVRASLEEKSVQLKSLERENMRLVEDKTALEGKTGGRVSTPAAVTAPTGSVRQAPAVTPKVVVDGRIKEVRMDSMLASLSIGSANGVKVGDVLFVVRGGQFICNINVTNVDVDAAVGQITMLKSGLEPQAGDLVTNKL
jgi:flagellar biosynthesis chaperone FliJ